MVNKGIRSLVQMKPSADWTMGSHLQLGFDLNSANAVSQTRQSIPSSIDIRRAEVYVSSKYLGTLFLGKGETASDDTALSTQVFLSGINRLVD